MFPGNSSVNTVQHATIDEAVFSMLSVLSRRGTMGLRNPLLGNGSVNPFPHIGRCYGSGDIINNRDSAYKRSECRSKLSSGQLQASCKLEERVQKN
jgi:hypothetical protein